MSLKSLKANNAYNLLPKYLILSGIYNVLFQYIGVSYIYIYVYIIGVIWASTKKFSKLRGIDLLVILYLILILINTSIAIVFKQLDVEISSISSLIYLLPIIFWFFYYNTNRSFDFNNLVLSLKWHIFIIAILGLIQYYFSPNLFGILTANSNNIQWATENESYKTFFRATSILGSPQVFGAFISLYIVLFVFAVKEVKSKVNRREILYIIFLFIAGAHSANKAFFGVLFIFVLYLLYKKKFFMHSVVLFSVIIFFVNRYKDNLFFLQRIFFNEDIVQQEKTGRISIWKNALSNIKIFGDGPGSWSNSSINIGNQVAESYFLQVLSELGFLAIIIFTLILITNFYRIRRTNLSLSFISCAFIMLVVHVFNSPAFILYWGGCLYGLKSISKFEKFSL